MQGEAQGEFRYKGKTGKVQGRTRRGARRGARRGTRRVQGTREYKRIRSYRTPPEMLLCFD